MNLDKKTLIRMGYEKYEAEKIRDEIFSKSTEHQYYLLGVAQGLYFLYKTFYNSQNKDATYSQKDLLEIINYAVEHNKDIEPYFKRLLIDIDI
jgi:hypothetical protein